MIGMNNKIGSYTLYVVNERFHLNIFFFLALKFAFLLYPKIGA
jgi:hypothetical protein